MASYLSCLPSLNLLLLAICYYSTLSVIHAGTIATTNSSQYTNQTIRCAVDEPCAVLCQHEFACKLATIWCPVAQPCDVKCNDSMTCDEAVIHAETSSSFRLLDCEKGSWTCRGITIYFPPNHQGVPVGKIIGADIGFAGKPSPLQFYAANGWKDINITTNPSFSFTTYHIGIMHCTTKDNQSATCDFAPAAWSCANANDICNDPDRTVPPSTQTTLPSTSPTSPPTAPTSTQHATTQTPTTSSKDPTAAPTKHPALISTHTPTQTPTDNPPISPTLHPTPNGTRNPTLSTIVPTRTPTEVPTVNPTTSPTMHTTSYPTNIPTASTLAPSLVPSQNPTVEPTYDPTVEPSINPTVSPTLHPTSTTLTRLPSIHPSVPPLTYAPTFRDTSVPSTSPITPWSCSTHCHDPNRDHPLQIQAAFLFESYIRYDLTRIECFLYPIFAEWLVKYEFINTFQPCDIHIIYVHGGQKDETSCDYPPCIHSTRSVSNPIRRLLQIDGNTTMTLMTTNSETTNILERMSLNTAGQRFETEYLHHFAVALSVGLDIEQENHIKSFADVNPLWYVLIGLVVLLCCVVCIVTYQCMQARQSRKEAAKPQPEGQHPTKRKNVSVPKPNFALKKVSASSIDYGEERYNLKAEADEAPAIKRCNTTSTMELVCNPIHRSHKPKQNWTQLDSPESEISPDGHGFGVNTGLQSDRALDIIAGPRGDQVPKISSDGQLPVLPYGNMHGSYNQQAPNMPNAPWSAPVNDANYPPITNSWQPPSVPSNAYGSNMHMNTASISQLQFNPYNNANPYNNVYNNNQYPGSNYNQSALNMMAQQQNGNMNPSYPAPQYQAMHTHEPQGNIQSTEEEDGARNMLLDLIEEDEDDEEAEREDTNVTMVATTNREETRKETALTQMTTESSWRTTHKIEENEAYPTAKYRRSGRADTEITRNGDVMRDDDDDIMDDELRQMVLSATPIGAPKGALLANAEEEANILEVLDQETKDICDPDDARKRRHPDHPGSISTMVMSTVASPLTSPTGTRTHRSSKYTMNMEDRLNMIDESMIVSDYGSDVRYGPSQNQANTTRVKANTMDFKVHLTSNTMESNRMMEDVVDSMAYDEFAD